ncbi:MAG: discoidin domain-containing protein [Lentisphaeria bacterium]|nr:discoidin domain-containing protein [Lentisphaeria bacterium]
MRINSFLLAAFLGSFTVVGQGLLKNSDFSQTNGDETLPVHWTVPKTSASFFTRVNVDGLSGNESLRYEAAATAPCKPVTQSFVCKPNTDYVLTAAFKGDGTTTPLVEVYAEGITTAAARLSSKVAKWERFRARFNSGGKTRFQVRLLGSVEMQRNFVAVPGSSWFDDVQIYSFADAPEEVRPGKLFVPPGPNMALNAPYTLKTKPGYGLCADPGDKTQLTDGVYSVGYFWTQKTTVGWSRANPAVITIDLGRMQPIAGLSYNTAAGVAGVGWPSSILLFASEDGKTWRFAGDLVRLSMKLGVPSADTYSVHRFATSELKSRGRYVRLMVVQTPYTFVDEIEVYRGNDAWLQGPPMGKEVADPAAFFEKTKVSAGIQWRLLSDLAAIEEAVGKSDLAKATADALLKRVSRLGARIETAEHVTDSNFRTVLPLNPLHSEVYALNAPLLRARGLRGVSAWKCSRWEPLQPTDAPERPGAVPSMRIDLMRNEVRADAVNFVNAGDREVDVTLRLEGLPDKGIPVTLRDVLFTDTMQKTPVAAALPHARKDDDGNWLVSVSAGCSKQVWLSVERPTGIPAGEYPATLRAKPAGGAEILIPLVIRIYDLDFPTAPTMSVGGWDYTNGTAGYYGAAGNLAQLLPLMRDHYVDTPWATASVCPRGSKYDAATGILLNPEGLDFSSWDQWVERWKSARNYYVFLSRKDSFEGEAMGTDRFNTMVGDYFTAWVAHMEKQGLKASQLGVLIVDEPHDNKQDKVIIPWAKAIHAAQPDIDIFEDPTYRDPTKGVPEMFEVTTTLCPNTPMMVAQGDKFREFYEAQRDAGRRLWLYSCSGPAKLLDPIHYHRGQMWWAMRLDAPGSFYWALGCGGRIGNSWNAYAQSGVEYSPFFVGQNSVTDGKHFEAIREGVQDFEYFVMLRNRVAGGGDVAAAKKWLARAPVEVTASVTPTSLTWKTEKDRDQMDRLRVQALTLLERLR